MSVLASIDGLLLFAGRGRAIQRLLEGDPVAWSILGGVVVIMGGVKAYKVWASRGGGGDDPPPTAE